MATATSLALSANDARILNALFDPETLPSSVARSKQSALIDAALPPHPAMSKPEFEMLEAQQTEIVLRVSSASDITTIEDALKQMDAVVEHWPTYPSPFVNRAMLRRLKMEAEVQGLGFRHAKLSDIGAIILDLSTAISHASPSAWSDAAVSPFQARILRTAYSHRAYLHLKCAETGRALEGKDKSELEEMASNDFAAAARYGDEAAREMSVRTNPYAKMCGAIVRNALEEERKEEMSR